ncbi:aminomethyltransferase [Peptococcaceae bacterium CEB3]|nr:aminomethyltransferase [Peptococcaceae bacterium CEB3]
MAELKRTPLYAEHVAAKAKVIDFGGWEMPVQYAGVIEEHKAVRTKAGLFDVSHMGEVDVQGPDALAFVNHLITNDASRIADGQILYSPMCYPNGGIVDDLLVYRYSPGHFYLVVNASNTDKDYAWMEEQKQGFDVALANVSSQTAQLALQGPSAERILQKLSDVDLRKIKYYWFTQGKIDGVPCLISRTGYTGEDGFEFYFSPQYAAGLWNRVLESGRGEGIQPIGLGARDTLRFEARLPLYGNELGPDISPLEAGLGIFVKLDKPSRPEREGFVGQTALLRQKKEGLSRRLVGLEMIGRGIARSHYPVSKNGAEVGFVTSGSFSPTLDKNIALALVRADLASVGEDLEVIIRNKPVEARVIPTPFYNRQRV